MGVEDYDQLNRGFDGRMEIHLFQADGVYSALGTKAAGISCTAKKVCNQRKGDDLNKIPRTLPHRWRMWISEDCQRWSSLFPTSLLIL